MIADAVHVLWNSTLLLHNRFGTNQKQDEPNDAQLRCVAEEAFEFIFEATRVRDMWIFEPMIPIGHANIDFNEDVIEEAADLIVTVMGALQNLGVEWEEVEQAMRLVAAKNDQKTTKTHFVNAKGKIARKE